MVTWFSWETVEVGVNAILSHSSQVSVTVQSEAKPTPSSAERQAVYNQAHIRK